MIGRVKAQVKYMPAKVRMAWLIDNILYLATGFVAGYLLSLICS